MSENVEPLEAEEEDVGPDGKRQRSTIGFPYTDYQNAEAVVTAIHGNVGNGTCSSAQLSAWMRQSVKSSGFRTQLAAARLFGLIESDDPESLRLTELGRRIVDPAKVRVAKAEAFLRVPLFKALYERYKDSVIPSNAAAVEREIATLGVAEKQKARARQVFEGSAQQTGFKDVAPNRLVLPAVVVKDTPPPSDGHKPGSGNGGGGGGGGSEEGLHLDPLIMALLRKIPSKESGWDADKRLRWFKTFAMNVSQVYDDDDKDAVEIEIELKDSARKAII